MYRVLNRGVTFFDYAILARPYTIPAIILISLLANSVANQALLIDLTTFSDVIFGLFLWFAMVYLNESFKTQYGRAKINFIYPLGFFAIAVLIAFIKNPITLILLVLAALSTLFYFFKSKKWAGSCFMFIFRAGVEGAIFFSILLFHGTVLTYQLLILGLLIIMLTDIRNLIGDMRDVRFDKYTFPVKYGVGLTKALLLVLLVFCYVLFPNLFIFIPLLVSGVLLFYLNDFFFLHKLFVVSTSFYLLNHIATIIGSDALIISNMGFFIVLATTTYELVPRPSNPRKI